MVAGRRVSYVLHKLRMCRYVLNAHRFSREIERLFKSASHLDILEWYTLVEDDEIVVSSSGGTEWALSAYGHGVDSLEVTDDLPSTCSRVKHERMSESGCALRELRATRRPRCICRTCPFHHPQL